MGRRRKVRDTPKKAMSAYAAFVQDQRPSKSKENPHLTFAQVAQLMGDLWQNMSQVERIKYQEIANQDKLRYAEEKESWMKRVAAKASNPDFQTDASATLHVPQKKRARDASMSTTPAPHQSVPAKHIPQHPQACQIPPNLKLWEDSATVGQQQWRLVPAGMPRNPRSPVQQYVHQQYHQASIQNTDTAYYVAHSQPLPETHLNNSSPSGYSGPNEASLLHSSYPTANHMDALAGGDVGSCPVPGYSDFELSWSGAFQTFEFNTQENRATPQTRHNDPQPRHNDPQPRHNDPQPRHNDPQPRHNDPQPRHNDPQPRHNDSQPPHNDSQPRHNNSQPRHTIPQPHHAAQRSAPQLSNVTHHEVTADCPSSRAPYPSRNNPADTATSPLGHSTPTSNVYHPNRVVWQNASNNQLQHQHSPVYMFHDHSRGGSSRSSAASPNLGQRLNGGGLSPLPIRSFQGNLAANSSLVTSPTCIPSSVTATVGSPSFSTRVVNNFDKPAGKSPPARSSQTRSGMALMHPCMQGSSIATSSGTWNVGHGGFTGSNHTSADTSTRQGKLTETRYTIEQPFCNNSSHHLRSANVATSTCNTTATRADERTIRQGSGRAPPQQLQQTTILRGSSPRSEAESPSTRASTGTALKTYAINTTKTMQTTLLERRRPLRLSVNTDQLDRRVGEDGSQSTSTVEIDDLMLSEDFQLLPTPKADGTSAWSGLVVPGGEVDHLIPAPYIADNRKTARPYGGFSETKHDDGGEAKDDGEM